MSQIKRFCKKRHQEKGCGRGVNKISETRKQNDETCGERQDVDAVFTKPPGTPGAERIAVYSADTCFEEGAKVRGDGEDGEEEIESHRG